ncbi:4-hydroxy-tetrahydrodipicolinate synthase [Methylophilaceae bacterium]|nr:4-hydroxy-tetrahydrodipicolinate synthase [Methylophilaceae bacterium]
MFQGSIVALVTPMNSDGSVDIGNFRSLLDFHIENKTDGVVVLGTTGECPTVDFDEHTFLVKEAVSHINGRIPVIAGTGANSTKEAVFLTQSAKEVGADACLLVTPYYNKPNQQGLFEHYKAINDAVNIPQILYNVPLRTGCDLKNETVILLSQLSNIIGIKDATGELERIDFLKDKVKNNFIFISGDDLSFLDYMERGGCGVISVTANVKPDLMHNICNSILNGDIKKSKNINNQLSSLHEAMFIESNPIPVKWLLNYLGLINEGIRLPLVELDKKYHTNLIEAFKSIK